MLAGRRPRLLGRRLVAELRFDPASDRLLAPAAVGVRARTFGS